MTGGGASPSAAPVQPRKGANTMEEKKVPEEKLEDVAGGVFPPSRAKAEKPAIANVTRGGAEEDHSGDHSSGECWPICG